MSATDGSLRPVHPRPRVLSDLVSDFGFAALGEVDGIEITGITVSSNDVRPGDIFAALPGVKAHGAAFVADAVARGAVAVVTDAAGAKLVEGAGVPALVVDDPRATLGELSKWVYRNEGLTAPVFGVTGTNGKTSVIYLLDALLTQLGVTTGFSTTAERRIGGQVQVSGLTTPEASELNALIARMNEQHVQAILLEVSAQALSRHRVDGIDFSVVGFTNLSHDHLDDYPGYDAYFEAKAQLFSPDRSVRGVVLVDDEWGAKLANEARIPVTSVSARGSAAAWRVTVTEQSLTHTAFQLTGPQGQVLESVVPLLGRFMVANAALAIVMLVESGYDIELIAHTLERDGGIKVHVPGRAEVISGEAGPVFFVDYGHTPDAFIELLTAVRAVTPGRVIMLFGADGDRDTTKRVEMGAIAARGADVVIVTDFHPRTEDPALIRQALLEGARGAQSGAEICELADPREAVREAIRLAQSGDVIVYAGPGHEDYREVNGVHLPYNARDDVRLALAEAGYPPREPVREGKTLA